MLLLLTRALSVFFFFVFQAKDDAYCSCDSWCALSTKYFRHFFSFNNLDDGKWDSINLQNYGNFLDLYKMSTISQNLPHLYLKMLNYLTIILTLITLSESMVYMETATDSSDLRYANVTSALGKKFTNESYINVTATTFVDLSKMMVNF